MRRVLAILLLALFAHAGEDYERRFVEALRADLEGTGVERTAALVAPSVRAQLSPPVLAPVYAAQRGLGKVLSLEREAATPFATGRPVRFLLVQEEGRTHVTCVFDADGLLVGYWFKPAPPEWSLEETRRRMEAWKGDYGYHRIVLSGDRTREDGRTRGREVFPLGSAFKLYVLAEVARRVDEGTLALDAPVEIVEARKSFPSGVLHAQPAGAEVPLREMATKMIAISDNTATDHLIHLVGRENIEQRLGLWHNSVPERNVPFLTTRELFLVKGGGKEQEMLGCDFETLIARWEEAAPDDRREMVERLCAPFARKTIAELLGPIGLGYQLRSRAQPGHVAFEWFARPSDVTALLRDAHEGRLAGAATFLRFFAAGGEIYPREGLDYYGFKGGSETGVFVLSCLARRGDRTVAICVCRTGELDESHPRDTVAAAAALIRLGLE